MVYQVERVERVAGRGVELGDVPRRPQRFLRCAVRDQQDGRTRAERGERRDHVFGFRARRVEFFDNDQAAFRRLAGQRAD